MRNINIFFGLCLLIIFSGLSLSAQNQLDMAFGATPSIKPTADYKGQVIQPDGKVIIWGGYLNTDTSIKGQIARLNTDGTVDTSFSYCSCHFPRIGNVVLQADGKMIVSDVAANFNPVSSLTAYRLNSDGSVDGTFSPVFPSDVVSVIVRAVQPDGKVIFEENVFTNNQSRFRLSRYHSDGSIDFSFTKIYFDYGALYGSFGDIKIAADGKIYFGYRNPAANVAVLRRYNSDGTLDNTWAQAGYIGTQPAVYGIDLQPDGKVLATGGFTSVNGFATTFYVRFLTTGAVDTTFVASGFNNYSLGIRYLSTGKILVAGQRSGDTWPKIYRLNSDGSLDSSLAENIGSVEARSLNKRQSDTDVSMEQEFSSSVSVYNDFVLDPSERPVFFGSTSGGGQQFYRLDLSGNMDSGFTAHTAEFATVHKIALQPDGKMIITGGYDLMGMVSRAGISRVNTDGSIDTSFDPGTGVPWYSTSPGEVQVLPDGKMLVNELNTYNGVTVKNLIRVNPDGSRDTSFSQPFPAPNTFAPQSDGKIVVGGYFTMNYTFAPRNYIGRVNSDGSLDTSFAPNLGDPNSGYFGVNSLAIQPDGKILIGGQFFSVNGFARSGIARLNTDGTLDQSFESGARADLMKLQPDGKVLAYSSQSGLLQRRNSDGSADPSFSSKTISGVKTMALRANGDIFLGGQFDETTGVRRKNFAWLNSLGRVENGSFLLGANDVITGIAVQSDGKILIGGNFTKFDGVARPGIARLTAPTFTTRTKFDFDGDGRSDISVFRPADGNWYLIQSTNGMAVNHFGQSGDVVVPSDYDYDGKTDLAIFRDGAWWYLNSSNSTVGLNFQGAAGDIPLRADFDGDNKEDFVYFRPSTVQWFINFSSYPNGYAVPSVVWQWGNPSDLPFTQDFDGDGIAGIGFYRPSEGKFYYANDNPTHYATFQWGMVGDVPVIADYDGDGRTDFAVWRPSNGAWYIVNSHDQSISILQWGLPDDKPVVGDYDGDGKADIAVWRPSNGVWFILSSTSGFMGMQWGLSTDKAIPNAYMQ